MTTNAPSNPRVTVLLPVYNGMPYLAEAIESVLAQTFADFELLIIDDASTDESVACVHRYQDPRIRLVRNERNMGQVGSLNRGLALSRAPYVARLDQDDVCLPDRLQQQVAVLDRHPHVGLVGSWLWLAGGGPEERRTAVVGMTQVREYGSFLGALLTYASPIDHPTAMFRRDAALAAGGYDESFRFCEDYALWCAMARTRWSAVVLRTPLIIRRVHEAQQSRTHAAVQQQNARRAHHALVASLGADGTAQELSQVLQMGEPFWEACPSQAAVQQAVNALEAFLLRLEQVLTLTPREAGHLRHRVCWWMGHGALMGMLQRRYRSLPVYRFALRGGWRMARYPAVWLYPVCLLCSPLLVPAVRRVLVDLARWVGHKKYVVRLWGRRLSEWLGRAVPPGARTAQRTAILYISYDGILEPLGQSQVLAYLRLIAKHRTVALLSYEKRRDLKDRGRLVSLAQELQASAIHWRWLRYHKRPSLLATGYDILRGVVVGLALCRRLRIHVVHARGYVASVIAVCLKRCCGTRFIFDMRGFWADEKVDAGQWGSRSLAYRLAKRWERRFFEEADAIVSLTVEGIAAFPTLGYRIPSDRPTTVVPTCVDLDRFVPGHKDPELLARLGLHHATIVGCVGNTGNWYLRDWILRYLAFLCGRLHNVKVLLVTRDDHARLTAEAVEAGVPPDRLVLAQAPFEEMPAYLRLLDLAVFFRKLRFSKQGSLAAKLGELLASGVPVVINEGIGDAGALIRQERVGVVLSEVSEEAFERTFERVVQLLQDPLCRPRCRQVAERHFDLHMGVGRYLDLYRRLNGSDEPRGGKDEGLGDRGGRDVGQRPVPRAAAAGPRGDPHGSAAEGSRHPSA